jgi:hypothetical protein
MKRKLWIAGGLLLLIVLNAAAVFKWIKTDTRPTAWDESIHTLVAFDYKERALSDDKLSLLEPAYFNYPPLYHYLVAATLGRVTPVADTGAVVNILGCTALIVIIFLLGLELMGALEGLTAAALFVSYSMIGYIQHITIIDLWLTVWIALGLYCLVKSEAFEKTSWSVGFGASLGLGLMTKWTAPAYLLFPVVPALYVSIRDKKWLPLLFCTLAAVIIAAPWYVINSIPALTHASGYAAQTPAGGVVWNGWKNSFWYAVSLYRQTGFLSLLLLPGIVAVFWRPRLRTLLLCVIGTYILFSLINNKNDRYFMPVLPAVALLSVAWLPAQRRWPQWIVLALALFFFVTVKDDFPRVEDWKHAEIIETVVRLKKDPSRMSRVVVVSNAPYFHSNSFNVDTKAMGIRNIDFKGVPKRRWFEFAEFVLTKSGDVGPKMSAGAIAAPVEFMKHPEPWFNEVYTKKAAWSLPDGSQAVLYQQEPKPRNIGEVGLFNMTLTELQIPNITAKNVELRAVPESKEKTGVGALKELSIRSGSLLYKGVELKNVSIRLIRPQVNLPLFLQTQEIQLLSLDRLKPSAELDKNAVLSLVRAKAKWLTDPVLELENGLLTIGGKAFSRIPLRISLRAQIIDGTFQTKIQRMSIAGIPVPTVFFGALLNHTISLSPNDDMLYYLDIRDFKEEGANIKITAS